MVLLYFSYLARISFFFYLAVLFFVVLGYCPDYAGVSRTIKFPTVGAYVAPFIVYIRAAPAAWHDTTFFTHSFHPLIFWLKITFTFFGYLFSAVSPNGIKTAPALACGVVIPISTFNPHNTIFYKTVAYLAGFRFHFGTPRFFRHFCMPPGASLRPRNTR